MFWSPCTPSWGTCVSSCLGCGGPSSAWSRSDFWRNYQYLIVDNLPARKFARDEWPFVPNLILECEKKGLLLGRPFRVVDIAIQVIVIPGLFYLYLYRHCFPLLPVIWNSSYITLEICDHRVRPRYYMRKVRMRSYSAVQILRSGISQYYFYIQAINNISKCPQCLSFCGSGRKVARKDCGQMEFRGKEGLVLRTGWFFDVGNYLLG